MNRRGPGIAFIAIGIAFLALGLSGRQAFLAIGIAFLVIGAVLTAKARRAG